MPLSPKQADKLGKRLRDGGVPSQEDLQRLGDFRDDHLEAMATVFFAVASLPIAHLALSARQKNANTIIEKLKTESGMALHRMQDIGGVRLLVADRLVQDDAIAQIKDRLHVLRCGDRIARPHAGYRAMHVIVEAQGKPIEIQVRTVLQNRWAQVFERLGDHWGRQIRRGEEPDDPHYEITIRGAPLTRSEVVRYMREDVSAEIAEAEGFELRVKGIRRRFPEAFELPEPNPLVAELGELEELTGTRLAAAGAMIEALQDLKELVPATLGAESMILDPPGPGTVHYLVGYERKTGRLVVALPCVDKDEVLARRRALEQEHRADPDFEVVLLSSQSKEELFRTHARYFEGIVELAESGRPRGNH